MKKNIFKVIVAIFMIVLLIVQMFMVYYRTNLEATITCIIIGTIMGLGIGITTDMIGQ